MENPPHSIAFWVLDAQKIDSALIYKNWNNDKLKSIIQELEIEIDKISKNDLKALKNKLKSNKYLLPELQRHPPTLKHYKGDLDYYFEKKGFLSSAEMEISYFGDKAVHKRYVLNSYQCLKADAILSDFWFINPRLNFSNQFFEEYLPLHNEYVKENPIFPETNLPIFQYEKEMFGKKLSLDDDFFQAFQITPKIAEQILQNAQADNNAEFAAERDMFYHIVEEIAKKKFIVIAFHYDFLYIHNSEPVFTWRGNKII